MTPESLLQHVHQRLPEFDVLERVGQVTAVSGTLMRARGLRAALGQPCEVFWHQDRVPVEVVGFSGSELLLMPLKSVQGIHAGAWVREGGLHELPPAEALLGRVVDGLGQPLDGMPRAAALVRRRPPSAINPLTRRPIDEPLDVGVRAINGLLRVGVGQRVGLFAGSGVGKSVLLGMLARYTRADVVVVGLIGERGREVQEFVQDSLGDGLARAVVVATPADDAPVLRLRGAQLATRLAEEFRAEGKRVLLLMDSLTRVAQAQREIGLALGEPPTSKGYTPSVFSVIPQLVERAGTAGSRGGSITAFYTVLMEEDDLNDPVVDAARAVLDGHIVLSRALADRGQFPAIDLSASMSRLLLRLTDSEEQQHIQRFRALYARYLSQEDLISLGAYEAGSDPQTDEAIRRHDDFVAYLRQGPDEPVSLEAARAQLAELFAGSGAVPARTHGPV